MFTWRLPVWLGLVAVIAAGLSDVACPATATAADPAIRVTLDKYRGFAPLDVRVRLLIAPHDDNRYVCVYLNGPVKETSSCFPHLPDATSSERIVSFNALPEGSHDIWAVLVRANRPNGIASTAVTVEIQ